MLLLIVKLGPERYAIETNLVAEVNPRVQMRELFLNTRIILVRLEDDRLLGLMAEDVTDTRQSTELTNVESGIEVEKAPYLSTVGVEAGVGMVQLIDIHKLLDQKARKLLYSSLEEFGADLQAERS